MSLDKLKSGWNSLNDSVDQKEIVTIKKMRKELYNSKYNRLKCKYRREILRVSFFIFSVPIFKIIQDQEMDNIFTVYWILGGLIFISIKLFISYYSLTYIKMDDNIHRLKRKLHEIIRGTKIGFITLIILLPICVCGGCALTLTKTDDPRLLIILLSLIISSMNVYLFYEYYNANKTYNSMLEDIKQLEELDKY